MKNEFRKDYVLDRWVVIASERAKRPSDFQKRSRGEIDTEKCPFCPGNEHMTPPSFLTFLPSHLGGVTRDVDGERTKDWLVRCIPNLYPAVTPRGRFSVKRESNLHMKSRGVGSHEVIIESPQHNDHPGKASLKQTMLMLKAYLRRLKELSKWDYVSIFRNHGREAGASLSHPHSQIIATPMFPKRISDELLGCLNFLHEHNRCVFCEIADKERLGPRAIFENRSFIAFAPWASIYPFEFWVLPKKHQYTLLQLKKDELRDFAEALKVCFKTLSDVLHDPPYSYGFHTVLNKKNSFFHWHLEVYPKLSIQAGFEKSTEIYINVTPPEVAAKSLREDRSR